MLSSTFIYFFLIPQTLLKSIIFIKDKIRFHLEVKGLEAIPSSGATIILCPQQSPQDWAYLQLACPRKIHFIGLEANHIKHIPKWYRKNCLIPSSCKKQETTLHPKTLIAIINHKPQARLKSLPKYYQEADIMDAQINIKEGKKGKKQVSINFKKSKERN